MIYTLMEPVVVGTETVSEIQLRKPKTKDLRTLGATLTVNELLNFAQLLSNQSKFVFDEMCLQDGQKVLEIVSVFFQSGPQAGPME